MKFKKLKGPRRVFMAVRGNRDSGNEWIDVYTASNDRPTAMDRAIGIDKKCFYPWAQDNPIIRVAEFLVTEFNSYNKNK